MSNNANNILHYLVCKADSPDASTCDRGYVKLSDTLAKFAPEIEFVILIEKSLQFLY
jgi:hypothetical protein